ncbi:MAG: hypothetical protein K6T75_06960 [Acetobacteraceae bacterium]|nr:hypothetical protein [Acetobacteraceae bacterium]
MEIRQLQAQALATSERKGWWWAHADYDLLMRKLMLLASEVGEAARVVQAAAERAQVLDRQALAEELADCVIRAADIAGHLGLDLDRAVEAKLRRNQER